MIISDLPIVMIRSLIFTLIIEISVAFIIGYRKKDLVNILLVNVLTNPLLNSTIVGINYYYGNNARNITLIVLEIVVVVVEGYIFTKYLERRKINGYLLSLILNLASYLLGIIINKIIYWKEKENEKEIWYFIN